MAYKYTGGESITCTISNVNCGNAAGYWYTGSELVTGQSYTVRGILDDLNNSTSTDFTYNTKISSNGTVTFKTVANLSDGTHNPSYVLSYVRMLPKFDNATFGPAAVKSTTIEIRQKVNSVSVTSSTSKTFGDAAFTLAYTVSPANAYTGSAVSFSKDSGSSVTLSGTANKTVTIAAAGTSTLRYTSADGKCTGTFNVNVAKANPVITMSDTTLTFTGSTQYMTAKVNVSGIMYETWNGNEPTTSVYNNKYTVTANTAFNVENATNVGSWTVKTYFIPTDTANYNNIGKNNALKMNARNLSDVTATWGTVTFDYNGGARTVTPTLKYGTITLVSGTDYTISNNSRTAAGTQTVTVTGKGNYTGTKTTTLTVNKVAASKTNPSNNAPTYNGSAVQIIKAGSSSHGTFYYNTSASDTGQTTDATAAALKATNAGTYTRYWKFVADSNHTGDVAWTALSCSIGKAASSMTNPGNQSVTYGGATKNVTITCTNCSVSSASSSDSAAVAVTRSGNTITLTPKTNVNGGATITLGGTGNTNYNNPANITFKTTIVKADQAAPTATGGTATYPTAISAQASGGGGQGSLEWSNGSGLSTVGSITTSARWSGNTNYNASPYSNAVTLTVNKGTSSITASSSIVSLTYYQATNVTLTPTNCTIGTPTISNSAIATISKTNNTLTITGKATAGTATITVPGTGATNYNNPTSKLISVTVAW